MFPVPTWYWLPETLPVPVTFSKRIFVGPPSKPQHLAPPMVVVVVVETVVVVLVLTVVVVVDVVLVVVVGPPVVMVTVDVVVTTSPGKSCAVPGSAMAPGPGRSPF